MPSVGFAILRGRNSPGPDDKESIPLTSNDATRDNLAIVRSDAEMAGSKAGCQHETEMVARKAVKIVVGKL
ncbi:hypothetical protein MASR2M48_33430 [Spirochaetota bacterium]